MNFEKGAFVSDLDFTDASGRMTVNRLHVERANGTPTVAVAPDDIVLVTTGSQAADLRAGTMDEAPPPEPPYPGRSWALWKTLAAKHKGFGDPSVFFGDDKILDSRWVTFTVTTKRKEFLDEIINLTGSGTGSGGLLTLKDSPWVISLSIFEQPEILDQPPGTSVWWGYGLHPENKGTLCGKPMNECTGSEILWEILHHLKMEKGTPKADTIVSSSICIPCDMPYVNNIWLKRKRGDRPPVVPEGMTNLGLLGQYVELEREITFTFEYSARTAWEAVYRLVKRGPPPPDVYQGQYDLKGVWAATKVFPGSDEDLGGGHEARAPFYALAALVGLFAQRCPMPPCPNAAPPPWKTPPPRHETRRQQNLVRRTRRCGPLPHRQTHGSRRRHGKSQRPQNLGRQARRYGLLWPRQAHGSRRRMETSDARKTWGGRRADVDSCGPAKPMAGRRRRQNLGTQARRCGEFRRRESDENCRRQGRRGIRRRQNRGRRSRRRRGN